MAPIVSNPASGSSHSSSGIPGIVKRKPASNAADSRPKASFWRKLGGGSLSISLIVHGIILAIGIVWVVSIIPPPPEKKVDFMPSGGGGGSPAASEVKNKKRSMSLQSNAPRMAAVGAESKFALPEPDTSSEMSSLGSLGGGGLSAGLGGGGTGGGKGEGNGKGFGSGMGPGLGGGGGAMNPFGMIDPNANALIGAFYNLNRNAKGEAVETDNTKQFDAVRDFVSRGWKDSTLAKYNKAQKKLYQTRINIPAMAASAAPTAFGLTPDPHPRWIVVYRGTVTPPKTGKYRFVGAGDDAMVVRFNGKNVFDHGWLQGTSSVYVPSVLAVMKGESENREVEKRLRESPMPRPVKFYQYPSTPNLNQSIGGVALGAEFEARAGTPYPVDILITEGYGGLFSASLLIEEVGATYEKAPTGAPVLPLFRTDRNSPPQQPGTPPNDDAAPEWKVVGGRSDI